MGQNLTLDKINMTFSVISNRVIQFERYEYDIGISQVRDESAIGISLATCYFLKTLGHMSTMLPKHSSNLFSITLGRRGNNIFYCNITVAQLKFLSALPSKHDCRFMVLGWNKLSSDVYLIEISPDTSVPCYDSFSYQ